MSANDVRGLTQVVTTEVAKLRDRAKKAGDDLKSNMDGAHQVITHVETMNSEIAKSVADLQAVLGLQSNHAPAGQRMSDVDKDKK